MSISLPSGKLEIYNDENILRYSIYHNNNKNLSILRISSAILIKEEKIIPYYPFVDSDIDLPSMFSDFKDNIGKGTKIFIATRFVDQKQDKIKVYGSITIKYYSEIMNNNYVNRFPMITFQIKIDTDKTDMNLKLYAYAPIYSCNHGSIKLNDKLNKKTIRFYSNGHQSWSHNYSLGYYDKTPRSPIKLLRRMNENQDSIKSRYFSEMHTVISCDNNALILGFISNRDQFTRIIMNRLDDNGKINLLSAYSQTDSIAVVDLNHGLKQSEILMISLVSDPVAYEVLEFICKITGFLADVNHRKDTIAGWCSWYYYYTNITEKEMISNIEYLKKRPDLPLSLIQLDDGYQTEIGDWGLDGEINNKFPSGLKWLVDTIHENNFLAGIWMAPFCINKKSKLYRHHPQWILKGKRGKNITAMFNWKDRQYGLDISQPKVEIYLENLSSIVSKTWNFDYFKIDFLFASSMIEVKYQNYYSRAQIIRKGVSAIRKGMGDDKFILGCGAPLGPCVGLVDVMRIGEDTSANWAPWEKIIRVIKTYLPSLKPALLATIMRSYMHKTLWINDPDCVIIRKNRSKLTYEEVIIQLTIFGISCGQIIISDDEDLVDEDRINLLKRILPVWDQKRSDNSSAIPLDIFINKIPELYARNIKTVFGKKHLIAVINWGKERNRQYKLADLISFDEKIIYPSSQKFIIFDYWNEKILGVNTLSDELSLLIPKHGCIYLVITPYLKNFEFVSSTIHILSGVVEFESVNINDTSVHIKLSSLTKNFGKLFFISNKNIVNAIKLEIIDHSSLYVVDVNPNKSDILELQLE